jgi:hypothetical protein
MQKHKDRTRVSDLESTNTVNQLFLRLYGDRSISIPLVDAAFTALAIGGDLMFGTVATPSEAIEMTI